MSRTRPGREKPTDIVVRARATVVTVTEILERTGVGRASLYRWIKDGKVSKPLGRLSEQGRKGGGPVVWDVSVIAVVEELRGARVRLTE